MAIRLKNFEKSEIKLSQEEAWNVIRFFWPAASASPGDLTDADRSFAQGLLVEAIDGSYNMGFVELLFKSFYMKVPNSFDQIGSMVKSFAKAALKHWFKHATQADLADPKIYESVRATLARNFSTVWRIREQTGELIY
jgi:hypothetical protein